MSYNRPALLKEALEALVAQTYEPLEITVVDNQSPASQEIARLVSEYPCVKLIRNETNLGYAAGMNKGIENASGRYVCLTEDDVALEKDCIRLLAEHLSTRPETAVVSPILYNRGDRKIRCAGGEVLLGPVYRKKVYGEGERDVGQFPRPFAVTYIDGATMFARADLWRRLKGFRPEFFMYVEAVEFCARVVKLGQELVVVPQAKAYHFEPIEELAQPEMEFHRLKNFFSLYLLHAPLGNLPEFFFRYAVWTTLRSLFGRERNTLIRLRALLWVLRRAPALFRERNGDARREVKGRLETQEAE